MTNAPFHIFSNSCATKKITANDKQLKQRKTNVCEPIQHINKGKGKDKMCTITEDLQQQDV